MASASLIEEIRSKMISDRFILSVHAETASRLRGISEEEIIQSILNGEIIEDYPNDRYGPSCLIFGYTETGRPLHVQITYPTRDPLRIVTTYEPDPKRWIDNWIRRK